jgi:nitrate/nitrite transporter NarK
MVALTLASMGTQSTNPVFWALPSAMLSGVAAAGGIAMINAIGNLGAWLGPWMFGLVKDATGSDNMALLCIASGPLVSAIAVVLAGHDRRLERIPPRARMA